ncbi:hypothetical protein VP01_2297g3 [Puccinia sorghi]|uniref:Uncharacterized protein n=1 Tax=Puccinia sorghi TaxID=27349 RepID=A0A0L6V848_9BASI|nr:hypothetical protein VP01_2297g3 [Puccinia sorghi]
MASSHTAAHSSRRRQPTTHQQPLIPSFYENINGQWVLSDNWNLYGLSGSNQRHRARSLELDEAPNLAQSNLSSSASSLIHHSSALSSSPSLQYDVLPPTNASSNTNNQKLYLPAGWNHTSKRGPLYATSVIIVASLLTAIAVLSTVICLVARRRARGKRRAMLKEGLCSPSDPKLTPSEIEEGRAITTGRRSRLKNQIKLKLKQLTIVKINHSPSGKQLARISRINVHPGQPGDPHPPSLIIVNEARRSSSFVSHSSFRCTGESAGSSRRRTRPHRIESQSDESPANEPQHNRNVTLHGLLGPSHLRPSDAPTFTPAPPLPAQIIVDSAFSLTGPCDPSIRPIEIEAEMASRHEESVPINTYSNSTPEFPRFTESRQTLSHGTAQSGEPPVLIVNTADAFCATSQTRHQETSRASVTPNYRSCREIIRARSSTFSPHYATRAPGLLISSPASLPDLNFHIPPLPSESFQAQNLPHPTTRRRTRSTEPFTISGTIRASPVESTVTSLAVAEPLPPAYSGRATPGVGESSRSFEKQRIIDPPADKDDVSQRAQFLEDDPRQSISQHHHQEALNRPFVAHVATDDKLVLRSLMRMGSTPAMGSRTMGEKEEMPLRFGEEEEEEEALQQGGDESRRTRVEEGVDRTGSSGGRIAAASSSLAPSAPPLVHQGDEEDAAYDGFTDKRRSGPSDEPLIQQGGGTLNDDQVGGSASSLAILPAPPAQFIIRFDPSTSLVDQIQPPFSHQPPEPDDHHPRQINVVASAPPLNLRLSKSSSRHSSLTLSHRNPSSSSPSSSSSSSHHSHPNHSDELNITAITAPPYVE